MKRLFSSVCVLLFVFSQLMFAGEPYAKKVDVPKSVSQDDPRFASVMIINASIVPDKASVEIPPYPGARIYQTRPASEMTANDEKMKTLPYIKLLSTDPYEKVLAWYKEKMTGYSSEDVFGTGWIFWKRKGKFNSLDIRDTMTSQNLLVSIANKAFGYDEDMKGTKTVIEVTYVPK